MKTILMMISLLLTGMLTANGAQFEIGIGRTTFQAGPNGTWYQDGFPSTMGLHHDLAIIGVTGRFHGMRWHMDYRYLGTVTVTSQDVTDMAYDPNLPTHCSGPCTTPLMGFSGEGSVWGVSFTVAPSMRFGRNRIYLNVGPFLYRSTWHETITNDPYLPAGSVLYMAHQPRLQVTGMIGVGFERGQWGIEADYFPFLKATGDGVPTLEKSAQTVEITRRF